ncbi:MAG TPA: hypothetical protein VLJ18_10255 [Thermoanaerobaculia bacterium]|nr:hypothetical protein [Thermoanaerobaculia bacterium]
MAAALLFLAGAVGAGVLVASCLCTAAALAFHFAPQTSGSARVAAIAVFACWLGVAVFPLLAALGLFRLAIALPLAIGTGGASALWLRRSAAARADLAERGREWRQAWERLREAPFAIRAIAVTAAAIMGLRLGRGLVAPPLGWDALTYHLVKAARWIRAGDFALEPAPDWWGAYEYFPFGGDSLWAWAMLPFHSDAPVAAAGVLVWALVYVAAYALGREFGGSRTNSFLGALAVALLPACANLATSGYVDNVTLFGSLAGSLFVCRVLRGAPAAEGIVAVAGLAVCAATKAVGLPLLALGACALGVASLRRGGRSTPRFRSIATAGVSACVAACAAAPPYVRAWVDRGSPLYPLPVVIAGRRLLAGNPEIEMVLGGLLTGAPARVEPASFFRLLFVPDAGEYLNLGPCALFLVVLGFVAAIRLLSLRSRFAPGVLFLVMSSTVAVQGLFGPNTLGLRTIWVGVFGRFLLPAVVPFAVLAATIPGAPVTVCLSVCAFVGCWLAVPHGFSREDLLALAWLAGAVLVLLVAGSRLAAVLRPRRTAVAAIAVLTAAALVVAWSAIRSSFRYRIWQAAAEGRAFDMHPLGREYMASVPIWRRLDDGVPRRLAVAAGWNGVGDNWYWYPLFGEYLQNDVVYVTPTEDGSIVDYRLGPELRRKAAFDAWIRRLVERRVDVVVLLAPPPPNESLWAKERSDLFAPLAVSRDARSAAFTFDRDAAARWLVRRGGLPVR